MQMYWNPRFCSLACGHLQRKRDLPASSAARSRVFASIAALCSRRVPAGPSRLQGTGGGFEQPGMESLDVFEAL